MLAATLLPLYGIYSGFELVENVPVRAGSEEYLDSEKYQIRPRDYDAPGNINDDVARLNAIRCAQPALQRYANLSFHESENPAILFYRKAAREPVIQWTSAAGHAVPAEITQALGMDTAAGADILVAVNADARHAQETMVHVPILPAERGYPFELVAEDKWGYKWIKWIEKIELTDNPNYRGYWEQRGYSNSGNLNGSYFTF